MLRPASIQLMSPPSLQTPTHFTCFIFSGFHSILFLITFIIRSPAGPAVPYTLFFVFAVISLFFCCVLCMCSVMCVLAVCAERVINESCKYKERDCYYAKPLCKEDVITWSCLLSLSILKVHFDCYALNDLYFAYFILLEINVGVCVWLHLQVILFCDRKNKVKWNSYVNYY